MKKYFLENTVGRCYIGAAGTSTPRWWRLGIPPLKGSNRVVSQASFWMLAARPNIRFCIPPFEPVLAQAKFTAALTPSLRNRYQNLELKGEWLR
jgi:hypothetical protein